MIATIMPTPIQLDERDVAGGEPDHTMTSSNAAEVMIRPVRCRPRRRRRG